MSWALVYWFIKSSLSESFNSEDYIYLKHPVSGMFYW